MPRSFRPGDAGLIYTITALSTLSQGALELVLPLHLNRLGHALSLVGLTMALLGFGSLLSRLPGGTWYRLERARLQVGLALAVFGLTTLLLALTSFWPAQAALALVHGFGFGLSSTFLLAFLVELHAPDENAGPRIAWYTASVATGYALGALVGAQSIERLGDEATFGGAGLLGLVAAGLAVGLQGPQAILRDRLGSLQAPRSRAVASELQPGAPAHEAARLPAVGWRAVGRLPAGVWLAALLGFYINFVKDTYDTFFPIYALGVGVSLGAIGFMRSANSVASAVIRFAAGGVLRFLSADLLTHGCVLAMAAVAAGLSIARGEALLTLLFVVFGLSRALIRVTSATLVAQERIRSRGSVGMSSAVYNAGLDAGAMLGPPAAGALASVFDIPTSFRLVALVLPLLYYVVWFAQRARAARQRLAETSATSSSP